MQHPDFIVRLADLERGKRHYEWELSAAWLRHALEGTEAAPQQAGSLVVDVSLTSRQVVVRGRAEAKVTMPCARTLDPVDVELSSEIFLVLGPAATAQANASPTGGSQKKGAHWTALATEPTRPSQRKPARRPELELTEDDAAEDTYTGDQVVLDEFVREFLVLELPMMPVRSDLRSEARPAIPAAPDPSDDSDSCHGVDPRLRPLAEIASRLSKKTKE